MPIAYGYARVSTDKQGELGIAAQKKCIQDLWETYLKKDYPELQFFIDEDVSARQKEFAKRPQAKSLCLRVTDKDCIVLPKLDRGFRCMADAIVQLKHWEKTGVKVVCADIGMSKFGGPPYYDSKNLVCQVLLFGMMLGAELEGHRASQRTHDFNRSQRAIGGATGSAPWGFKNVRRGEPTGAKRQPPAFIQPEDNEQEMARFLVKNKENGNGCKRIAKHLEANGLVNRVGKPWTTDQLETLYRKWRKIVAYERAVKRKRGYGLREWEFMSPAGRILIRFDKEHMVPADHQKETTDYGDG